MNYLHIDPMGQPQLVLVPHAGDLGVVEGQIPEAPQRRCELMQLQCRGELEPLHLLHPGPLEEEQISCDHHLGAPRFLRLLAPWRCFAERAQQRPLIIGKTSDNFRVTDLSDATTLKYGMDGVSKQAVGAPYALSARRQTKLMKVLALLPHRPCFRR